MCEELSEIPIHPIEPLTGLSVIESSEISPSQAKSKASEFSRQQQCFVKTIDADKRNEIHAANKLSVSEAYAAAAECAKHSAINDPN